jgi:hypothetical protein
VFLAERCGPVVELDALVGFSSSSCNTLGGLVVLVLVALSLEENNLLAFSSSTNNLLLVQRIVTLAFLDTLLNSCVTNAFSVDNSLSLDAEVL